MAETPAAAPAHPAASPTARRQSERPLRPRMLRFVEEYRLDGNAVQAAIRSGYTPAVARSSAYRMLRDRRIAERLGQSTDPDAPDMDGALRELSRLAFCNVMDLVRVDRDGRIELDPSRLDRKRAAGVRELIIDETIDKATGNVRRQVRLRMADRKDALVKLIAGMKLETKAHREGVAQGRDAVLLQLTPRQFERQRAARKRQLKRPVEG